MRTISILLVFFFSVTALAQTKVYTVDMVPNVKVDSNNLVSNPDGILSLATVRSMDQKLKALEAKTSAQVAVVALGSIGDQDIFNFAQELFTKWGIGQASNDNGLLILLVLDQRTVRFHTGQGLEGILPDVICKRIQMEHMVPLFKEDRNDEAMMAGVDKVITMLTDPNYADEVMMKEVRSDGWDIFFRTVLPFGCLGLLIGYIIKRDKFLKPGKAPSTPMEEMRMSKAAWIAEFGVIPIGILLVFEFSPMLNPILESLAALYGYFLLTLIHKRIRMNSVVRGHKKAERYKRIVDFLESYRIEWLIWGILYPIPFLPHYFFYRHSMTFYRNHPRKCRKCGQPARKLDEQADDAYLSKEKIFEEGLKSTDYDVWLCDSCGNYFELIYRNRFSKYNPCPKCKTKAYYLKGNRTVVSPTTSSSGKGEKTHECKFCGHTVVSTYSIARLSSSSSSGGGGGSSGGSFGGGSSGGGGASSSW